MTASDESIDLLRRAKEFADREGEPTVPRVISALLSFRDAEDTTDFYAWGSMTLVTWAFSDELAKVDEVLTALLPAIDMPEEERAALVPLAVRLRGLIPSANAWLVGREAEAEAEQTRQSVADARAKWDVEYERWRRTGKGEAPWDREVARSLERGLDLQGIRYERVKVRTVGGRLKFTIVLAGGRTLEDFLPPERPGQRRCMHAVGSEVAAHVAALLADEEAG